MLFIYSYSRIIRSPEGGQLSSVVGLTRVYRIPADLDLSPVVGEFTTQIRVGQFDLQFTFGRVNFTVESPVDLYRDRKLIAHWEAGRWPDPGFYELINSKVRRCEVANDRLILFEFENSVAMHLRDSSEQYECLHIAFEGEQTGWII